MRRMEGILVEEVNFFSASPLCERCFLGGMVYCRIVYDSFPLLAAVGRFTKRSD